MEVFIHNAAKKRGESTKDLLRDMKNKRGPNTCIIGLSAEKHGEAVF